MSKDKETTKAEAVVEENLELGLDMEEIVSVEQEEVEEGEEEYQINSVSSSTGEVQETGIVAQPFRMEMSDYQSAMDKLTRLSKMERMINLCGDYWDANKVGDSIRGIFYGIVSLNKLDKDGKPAPFEAIQLITEDKSLKLIGNIVVVNECRRINMVNGQPLELVYKGKNGRTKLFDIYPLGEIE